MNIPMDKIVQLTLRQREYLEAIELRTKGLSCISTNSDDGNFSWDGCELCGSPLGGTFQIWHAINNDGKIVHGERACVDCVVYFANGELPA